jgi:hypothetical protein
VEINNNFRIRLIHVRNILALSAKHFRVLLISKAGRHQHAVNISLTVKYCKRGLLFNYLLTTCGVQQILLASKNIYIYTKKSHILLEIDHHRPAREKFLKKYNVAPNTKINK